jgi:serine/threonine protein kinase
VKEKIGEGSFAEVFCAKDKERGVLCAVKQSHQFRKSLDR